MKIDFSNRIVFLANSKVASTSLEAALEKHGGQMGCIGGHPSIKHLNLNDYLSISGVLGTQKFRTVCVIRHPVAKVVSWYKYRARPALRGKPRYTGNMTLAEFIKCAPEKEIDDRYFVPDQYRRDSIDLIFKYENIDSLVTWLRKIYGPNFDLPRQNTSPDREIDADDLALARDRFAEAISWYEAFEPCTPPGTPC